MIPVRQAVVALWALSLAGCDSARKTTPPGTKATPAASVPTPALAISLDSASAHTIIVLGGVNLDSPRRHVRFEVQARLDNPGLVTHTVTNFNSIFDGFALVVESENGGEQLRRLHYTHHQSPFSRGRSLPVPERSTEQLMFPREWQNPPKRVRVFLEGTLPGSGNDTLLVSNVVVVNITLPDAEP